MFGSIQLFFTVLAAFFTLAYSLPTSGSSSILKISNAGTAEIIPNSYIVVMNASAATSDVESYMTSMVAHVAKRNLNTRDITGKRTLSTKVSTLSMGDWKCMTLEADDAMVNEMADSPNVRSHITFRRYKSNFSRLHTWKRTQWSGLPF